MVNLTSIIIILDDYLNFYENHSILYDYLDSYNIHTISTLKNYTSTGKKRTPIHKV